MISVTLIRIIHFNIMYIKFLLRNGNSSTIYFKCVFEIFGIFFRYREFVFPHILSASSTLDLQQIVLLLYNIFSYIIYNEPFKPNF